MGYDPRAYWIWLQHGLSCGSTKPGRILSFFPSIRDFCEAGEQEWRLLGIFTQKELKALREYPISEAEGILDACERFGQMVLTPDTPGYPQCLREIHNPPCALYVKGTLPDLDNVPSVAIVGTRDATLSGRKIAFQFGYQLAKTGIVVVSGGAKGIDTAAHKGALQAKGKTVCVLGCAIGYPYLMENEAMRELIAQNGALVSEFPPGSAPAKISFPIRNRLISGMGDGVLVVEAAGKSGSLITADLALEQGKDVFAVPCGIDSPVSRGVNNLIKAGAKPVTEAEDILEEYFQRYPGKMNLNQLYGEEEKQEQSLCPGKKKPGILDADEFSEDARSIYAVLGESPLLMEELVKKTGLTVPRIFAAVTELELAGKIIQQSGRRYCLSEN